MRVMSEVLHANIFFFIASVATVIFCILTCIILYQVIKILGIVRSVMERIEAGSEMIAEDIAHVRELVSKGGLVSRVMGFVFGMMGGGAAKRGRRRKSSSEDD